MSGNKVQDKPKTEQQLAQAFLKEYDALCKKHQYQVVTTPAFKARDDSTFSIVLQVSVGKLPQQAQAI